MPAGIVNSFVNATSQFAMTKPHYFLIGIVGIIIIILYSQRVLKITADNYIVIITLLILILMSIIILATVLHVLQIRDSNNHIASFSNIFNSVGGRNFLAILSLVMFVVFICEAPEYGNNNPYPILDKITLGNNNIISNRTVGIALIFIFTVLTAYAVMMTSNEHLNN